MTAPEVLTLDADTLRSEITDDYANNPDSRITSSHMLDTLLNLDDAQIGSFIATPATFVDVATDQDSQARYEWHRSAAIEAMVDAYNAGRFA